MPVSERLNHKTKTRTTPSTAPAAAHIIRTVLQTLFTSYIVLMISGCGTGYAAINPGSSSAVAASGAGASTDVTPTLSAFYCSSAAVLGAGTDICTVKLTTASATSGTTVTLSSNNSAVSTPAMVTLPAKTTALQFPATFSSVQAVQQVTLTAATGGVTGNFALRLNPAIRTLGVSAASVAFAVVQENTSLTKALTLTSTGTLPLTISAATVSGNGFSVSGLAFPLVLNPGQTASLAVQFQPALAGAVSGQLALMSDSSSGPAIVNLSGTGGVPALSAFYCASAAVLGATTDICTIKLSEASATSGVTVNLASNNASVLLPATVTVPAMTTAFQFPATVQAVKTVQTATLTAVTGSTSGSFALRLNAATGTLTASTSSLSFANVSVNATATQTVTLSSTGTGPVHISSAALTGAGFALSGGTFPLVLNPGQTATLTVSFHPTTPGSATGQLALASDSTGGTAVVGITGTALGASLSSFYCSSGSILGTGTDICTVKLTMASPSGGTSVTLAVNNAAVTIPVTTVVPANATMVQFTANIGTVATAQTVTLSATAGGVSGSFALQLTPAVRTLSVSTASMAFGTVALNTAGTQTLTLSSTGTLPVTISSATVTGAGFSMSGATFPMTLTPNQKATVSIQFDPTTAGATAGQVVLSSNSTAASNTVNLAGTGTPATLSSFYCSTGSFMGAGTDVCTVKLNVASSGTSVKLSTSNAAVTMPASVSMTSTIFQFTANIASVPTTQAVTLTATAGGSTITYPLQLNAAIRTLSLSRSNVVFSAVAVKTTSTQSILLTSTGTLPVTLTGVTLTSQAFTISGMTFPLTLNPAQSALLTVQFNPSSTGATVGLLALSSDSSTGTMVVSLNGTSTRSPNSTAAPEGFFPYSGSSLVTSMEAAKPSTPIANTFLGMTVYNLAPNSLYTQPGMTPFPALPVSTFRFWDVAYWAMMEPAQGQYNWTKMDNSIAIAQQNGVNDFIYTFGHVPAWASTNPADPCTDGEGAGSCTAPNMAAFDDFTTKVVQRYCGKVKLYEPWNEPDGPAFWDGTNLQMLTITQHVAKIVKDPANCGCTDGTCSPNGGVNPNRVLLSPISNLSPERVAWLDTYLASAGSNYPYADIAAFHGYVWSGYQPEQIVSGVHLLQQTLAKYGMSNLELWNTEVSWQNNTNMPEPQQAGWLMRYHATQAALGVSRVLWYAYDQCTWGTLWNSPLCTPAQNTGQLTMPGVAYGTTADWIIGANLTHCQQYQDGLWACELQHDGGYSAWMIWSSTGNSLSVPIPQNLGLTTYRDWQNKVSALPAQLTVTSSPVLLEQ